VTGYGEFRPLKENISDDNRAANRRVEIKILKALEVAKDEAKKTVKSTPAPGSTVKPTPAPGNNEASNLKQPAK